MSGLYIVIDTDDADEMFVLTIGGSSNTSFTASSADASDQGSGTTASDEIAGVRALPATGAGGTGGASSGLLALAGATLAMVAGGLGLRRRQER